VRGIQAIPLAAALALLVPLCFKQISDPDPGWHLAMGRWIASAGLPTTNGLTWTAPSSPWYDTSWLWDWSAFALTSHFGLLGLQALTFLTVAVGIVALAVACNVEGPGVGLWVLPTVSLLISLRVTPRPHVATWTAMAVVLALCLSSQRRGPKLRAACLPVLVLASNLHSGACFAAGVLGLFCLQAFAERRNPWDLAIALAGVGALCANPGGAFDLRSMLFHLNVRDVVSIAEYRPPSPRFEWFFYLEVPVVIALAWRGRRRSPALLAAAVLFAALGLDATRMVRDFQWVAAPILARGLFELSNRVSLRAWTASVLTLTAIAAGAYRFDVQVFSGRWGPGWDETQLPVRAADFSKQVGLDGRLFNAYSEGGYLEWALPGVRAFVDGRVQAFPPELFAHFYAAEASPTRFQQFLSTVGVEWAIVPRDTTATLTGTHLLDGARAWALVYWDPVSEVFCRRDDPRYAEIIQRYEYRYFRPFGPIFREISDLPREAIAPFQAEIERFLQTAPKDPNAELIACAVRVRSGIAPQAACERAEELAVTVPFKDLVERAKSLPPLAP
jgi:hypothetical protein